MVFCCVLKSEHDTKELQLKRQLQFFQYVVLSLHQTAKAAAIYNSKRSEVRHGAAISICSNQILWCIASDKASDNAFIIPYPIKCWSFNR